MAVTSDNKFIVSGSQDKTIKVFDFHTKQEVYHFQNAHESKSIFIGLLIPCYLVEVSSVAVTSDNRFIVSGSRDNSIKIFDLHAKQEVHHIQNAHKSKFL